ncbi:hypothetical protein Tco_0481933 [Tanacetum coccineum]
MCQSLYPEYIPLEDEHVFSAEEQPLPPVVSPTAESPGYVVESDPEEDPEEYEDDETRKITGSDFSLPHILPPKAEVERLLAMPTPPPSPLILLSPPSATAHPHSSPPLVIRELGEYGIRGYLGWIRQSSSCDGTYARERWWRSIQLLQKLAELHEYDTQDLYAILEDSQDSRTRISQRVTMERSGSTCLWRIG